MTTSAHGAPWSRLPDELATAMAPEVGRLRAEILALIDADQAWAGRTDDAKVRADLDAATAAVLSRFIDLIGTSAASFTDRDRALFRELGAGEARDGRGLEDLLAAYRLGTRVIYAEFARALSRLDPSPSAQVALGEAVFALVDTLQAESADGYADEAATHAGERDRRLRRLVDALLQADLDTVGSVATQIGWVPPSQVAVALLPIEALADARAALSGQAILVEREGVGVAVLAAGPGQDVAAAVRRLAELPAAEDSVIRVGPTVPLGDTRRSLHVAHLLPERPAGASWADEQLPALLLRGAPEVAESLRESVLAPLDALRPAQRERLVATLAAWLRHWGQRSEIAAELAIHPQTVAYRVNQLRDLLGDDLDDPGWRLQMQLALMQSEQEQVPV